MKLPMWLIISCAVFALAACSEEPSYATRGDCLAANKAKFETRVKESEAAWYAEKRACYALGPDKFLGCDLTVGDKHAAIYNHLKAESVSGEIWCNKFPQVAQR